MVTFLVVIQAIAGTLLTAVGLFPSCQRPGGGLSTKGRILFGVSVPILIGSIAWAQVLNERAAAEAQKRIEQPLARLFELIAEKVMETPKTKGPEPPLPAPASELIRILDPPNGASVESRHVIRGQVSDRAGQVWVLVHPLETSSYWVQPRVSIARGGGWNVQAYFGRSGSVDSGKAFEVLAIVDPSIQLEEGTILDKWPPSRLASGVVAVTRK